MSGCGNDKCTCGAGCNGCSCTKNMDDSALTVGFESIECDNDGCSCSSCSNCAPSCGCTSCASSH